MDYEFITNKFNIIIYECEQFIIDFIDNEKFQEAKLIKDAVNYFRVVRDFLETEKQS